MKFVTIVYMSLIGFHRQFYMRLTNIKTLNYWKRKLLQVKDVQDVNQKKCHPSPCGQVLPNECIICEKWFKYKGVCKRDKLIKYVTMFLLCKLQKI